MQDLHTKYRPRTFDQVVGQDAVVKSIKTVLKQKSSHAFLFTGPSGVGKTTLARIIARELGCEQQNLSEIDAATHTGVDHWRLITDGLRYTPLGGSKIKAVIVDEAHSLSKAAWQSLLKDIEEPPEHVYWFICTTESGKIPATIKTRCTAYELASVKVDDLIDLIDYICEQEEAGPPEKIRHLIAREAGGSPREAITSLAACWTTKKVKDAATILKTAGESDEVISICRQLVKGSLTWPRAQAIIKDLDGMNPEGLRLTCLAYFTKVALGTKTAQQAERVMPLVDAFIEPYPPGNSIAPFMLAIAELVLD